MTNEAYDNSTILDPRIAERLKRDDKGLVAAVIQQFDTKEVLMVGYMNDEAIRRTLMTGRVTFWSRSRQEYWRRRETRSGHRPVCERPSHWIASGMPFWLKSIKWERPAIPANDPASRKAGNCPWS